MSHEKCVCVEGECHLCEAEAASSFERALRDQRGRWMVVEDNGAAFRYARKSEARGHVRLCLEAGFLAHVRRWRRDRAAYVGGCFEVNDARWTPGARSVSGRTSEAR